MGHGDEPPPRFTAESLRKYQREIMAARTRKELDTLTRWLWRTYAEPANDAGRKQLRAAIESKRAILKHSDPR